MSGMRSHATLFENISQVPPASIMIVKSGKTRIEPYWDNIYPTEAVLSNDKRSEAEIVSGFRAVLDDAVSERLTADVEVACYLSGGLDSSAVLAVLLVERGAETVADVIGRAHITSVNLIEVLTDRIARRLMRDQLLLSRVVVRVHKPFAPLPGVFRDVYAELSLNREEVRG